MEPHLSGICLRQFAMLQDVPSSCTYLYDIYKIDLEGKIDIDWGERHCEHWNHWNHKVGYLFISDIGVVVSDAYHNWYSSITLRYITRIGGNHCYILMIFNC